MTPFNSSIPIELKFNLKLMGIDCPDTFNELIPVLEKFGFYFNIKHLTCGNYMFEYNINKPIKTQSIQKNKKDVVEIASRIITDEMTKFINK